MPTSSRTRADATTADCLALVAEARRRAREQFGVELEQEVVTGPRSPDAAGPEETALARRRMSRGRQGTSRSQRAVSCAHGERRRPVPAHDTGRSPRARPARPLRLARCSWRSASSPGSCSRSSPRARRRSSASARSRSAARTPRVERQVQRALDGRAGESLFGVDLEAAEARGRGAADGRRRLVRPRLPPHAARDRSCPNAQSRSSARAPTRSSSPSEVASSRRPSARSSRSWHGSGWRGTCALDAGGYVEGELRTAVGAVAPLAGIRFPSRVVSVATTDELTLRLALGPRAAHGGHGATSTSSSPSRGACSRCSRRARATSTSAFPHRPVAGPQLSTLR